MKNYLSWEKKRFSLDHYINVIAQAINDEKLYNGGVPDLEKSLSEANKKGRKCNDWNLPY